MPRGFKVYGWLSYRGDCPPGRNGSQLVHYVVAAPSWQAAVNAVGPNESMTHAIRYGSVTGNDEDIAKAMSEPGTAFWIPDYEAWQKPINWRRA